MSVEAINGIMEGLPSPPYGPEIDVRDLDGFMLNVERLMASELVALSSHEVVAAAMFLWCRAWKQLPAATLPDDERVIAAFSRLPQQRFRRLKSEVLRGFYKCSNGRLYHRTLGAEAVAAHGRKRTFQDRRQRDADRLRNWRSKQERNGGETTPETQDETHFVREGREGTGKGPKEERGGKNAADSPADLIGDAQPTAAKAQRGRKAKPDTPLPDDFALTPELAAYATKAGFDPAWLLEKFRNKALAKGWTYKDWSAAFRNFATTERQFAPASAPRTNGAWRPPDC